MIGFFAIAGLGMALSVATFSVEQMGKFVVRPFLFVTGVQFALIVFQTVTGSPIGLTVFRPDAVLVVTNGGLVRPQGMYVHVYVAAAFALLCLAIALAVVPRLGAPSRWYLVGLASAAGTVAVTHSRSALLGFLIVAGIATGIAVRRAPLLRVATTVVGVAFVAAAAFTSDGWVARLDDSVTGDLDESSLGRITLVKQGLALARSSPLVGVGPGLYLEALADQDLVDEEFPYRVHSVPILLAAELGVVAAIVLTVVVGYAGFQAWRAGGEASMVFWSIVPLSMFDIVFYDRLNGLLLLGVWSGVCASMYLQNGKSGHREKWRRASAR
jgi:O-antigen ligase